MSKKTLTKLNRMYEFDLKGISHKRPEILPTKERKAITISIGDRPYTEYRAHGQIINTKKMIERGKQKLYK